VVLVVALDVLLAAAAAFLAFVWAAAGGDVAPAAITAITARPAAQTLITCRS